MSATGIGLALLTAAFAIAGQIADWELLNQIAMALAVALVVSYIWSRIAISGMSVERVVYPPRLQVEAVVDDELEVRSRSLFGKLWVEVRDLSTLPGHDASQVIGLAHKGTERWVTRSVCVKRGVFSIGPVVLRSGDPLGIFSHSRRQSRVNEVLVYPPVFKLEPFRLPSKELSGGAAVERRANVMTPSIATIRDYVAGDPMNRIAWQQCARNGKLMVKEFELDPTAELYVLADFEQSQRVVAPIALRAARDKNLPYSEQWMDDSEDYIAAIAASIAKLAIDSKRGVGYIGSTRPRQVLLSGRNDVTFARILEDLAVAKSNGTDAIADVITQESRRFDRLRVPVVITSSTDERWLRALAMLALRGVRPLAVFVDPVSFAASADQSPFLEELRQQPFDSYVVDYRQGIERSFAAQPALLHSVHNVAPTAFIHYPSLEN